MTQLKKSCQISFDIEAKGVNEAKEMKITLEKTMTFKFQVHPTMPELVKKAMADLVKHFDRTRKYHLEVKYDSNDLPEEYKACKRTRVEVKKDEGREYDTVSLKKYDEQQRQEDWMRILCFAKRPSTTAVRGDDPKREEKLERRRQKMNEQKLLKG